MVTISSDRIINLVYGVDKRYLMPMVVSLTSILSNLSSGYFLRVFVLHDNLEDNKITPVVDFFNRNYATSLSFININQMSELLELPVSNGKSLANTDYFSRSIYNRLYVTELLPSNIVKVIYLDSDTVVPADLSELWNINLEDKPIAAMAEPCGKDEPVGFRYNLVTDLGVEGYYFNSGVLVMDMEKVRQMSLITKSKEIISKMNLVFPDQDILNVIFQDYKLLAPKFNSMWIGGKPYMSIFKDYWLVTGKAIPYSDEEILTAMNNPVIIHYFMKSKPWHLPGYYHFHKEKFWHYYNKTLYANEQSKLIEQHLNSQLQKMRDKAVKNNNI